MLTCRQCGNDDPTNLHLYLTSQAREHWVCNVPPAGGEPPVFWFNETIEVEPSGFPGAMYCNKCGHEWEAIEGTYVLA